MEKQNEIKLGDLLEMEKLEKPEWNGVKLVLCGEGLKNGGLSGISEKIENNEDIKVNEVVNEIKGNVEDLQVDYYGSLISLGKFHTIHPKEPGICQRILDNHFEDLSILHFLPVKVAAKLVNLPYLNFVHLEDLYVDAAKELGKHEGYLGMYSLRSLSPELAEELARHKGSLELPRLCVLSKEAVEKIGKHQGNLTIGLMNINNEVVEELQKIKCRLIIRQTKLNKEQAKLLAKHEGPLRVFLTEINKEVAEELAKHNGELDFSEVKKITIPVAEELGKHQGILRLGLDNMSEAVAKNLGTHQGGLNFPNVRFVKKTIAKELSKSKGFLSFDMLAGLKLAEALELITHEGGLGLMCRSMEDEVIKVLAKYSGSIFASVAVLEKLKEYGYKDPQEK